MPKAPPPSSNPSFPGTSGGPVAEPVPLDAAFRQSWAGAGGGGLESAAAHGVLVAFCALEAWRPWLGEMRGLLDAAENDRVARKRRQRDADDLALAYGLHRLVIAVVTGCEARAVPLARDALGRPYLQGDDLQTSLSHADGAVAVAVARHGPVGVDMEAAARTAQMEEIAGAVLHPDEQVLLSRLPRSARAESMLALWVRKEALLKAAGIGLAREMHGLRAPEATPVPLPAVDGPDGDDVVLRMLDAGRGWFAAVATPPGARVASAWLQFPAR